ncbi:hypothetical protein ACFLZ8_03700 [Planctomycetota bacterium]
MKTTHKITSILVLVVMTALIFCTGCGEGLKASSIYEEAVKGAIVGWIVGHQSNEDGEGAAIGAALFGVGELLSQLDRMDSNDDDDDQDSNDQWEYDRSSSRYRPQDNVEQVYIIQVHNSNGSITPIELRKQGNIYIGPKGEQYENLPTETDLKDVYGF